jgi:hypothetical protein
VGTGPQPAPHPWASSPASSSTARTAAPPSPAPTTSRGSSRRGPGHPLSTGQLKVRLARLGIHGRFGRNTALMDLAAKLPPVALARLLGIHIDTAGAWAERAGGSPAAYAAQVFRR